MIIVAFISSDLRLLPWKSNFQSVDSLSRVHTQKMWTVSLDYCRVLINVGLVFVWVVSYKIPGYH
jgi:hypothetical protein